MKCKMQDNLEFLQWMKKYWDLNTPGVGYDAAARRGGKGDVANISTNRSVNVNTPVKRAPNNGGNKRRRRRLHAPIDTVSHAYIFLMYLSSFYYIAPRSSIGRGSTNQLLAGNTSHRGSSPDHSVILSLQKELQEERNTVAALEKERDFYFGKLRDIEVFIQQDLDQSPEAGESQLLKEIQAVLYSTEVYMSLCHECDHSAVLVSQH